MKTASVRDLRNNFAKVSRWIKAGQEVEITLRGLPLAKLMPTPRVKAGKGMRFNAEDRRRWMKETYGDKVLPGNGVVRMREEGKW
jgi:prevent-host-death family protein